MREYLSVSDVATAVGLSVNTIKSYVRRGYLPAPDARIGVTYGWNADTITYWQETRPGRGARTDCPSWTGGDDRRLTCERTRGHSGKHQRDGVVWAGQ